MATPVKIRSKAGTTRSAGTIQVPTNEQDVAAAIEQAQAAIGALQTVVVDIIAKFNAHTHTANDTAVIVGQRPAALTAATAAAVNLFPAAPTS